MWPFRRREPRLTRTWVPKEAYRIACEERDELQKRYDELMNVLATERGSFREATLDAARKHTQERARWLVDREVIDKAVRQRDWQLEQQRERARQILAVLRRAFGLAEEITAPVQEEAQQALPCGCAPLDDAGCCASCGALLPDGEPHEAGCAHVLSLAEAKAIADPALRDLP